MDGDSLDELYEGLDEVIRTPQKSDTPYGKNPKSYNYPLLVAASITICY